MMARRSIENRSWEIYTLTDPRTLRARYVGVTYYPDKRLKHHLWEAARGSGRSLKKNWIRSLLRRGFEPIYLTIEKGFGGGWADRERFWIATHRRFCNLVNATDGGEGVPGFVPSQEKRQRQSEFMKHRIVSAETRLKKSVIGRGRFHSEETKAKISAKKLGVQMSVEARANMSAGAKGRVIPPDQRRKISLAQINKRGKRVKRVDTGEIYETITLAGRAVNRCRSAVYRSILRSAPCGGVRFEFVSGGGELCRG